MGTLLSVCASVCPLSLKTFLNVLTLIETRKKIVGKMKENVGAKKIMLCKYDSKMHCMLFREIEPHTEACFPLTPSLLTPLSPVLLKAMFTKTVRSGNA